jgi:hypothetical protein
MIDHTIGKGSPLTWTIRGSDRLSWCATQDPRRAPTNPMTMDVMDEDPSVAGELFGASVVVID